MYKEFSVNNFEKKLIVLIYLLRRGTLILISYLF